jgi:hypothetical protein
MDKIFNVLSKTNYFDSYYYDYMSPIFETINNTEVKFHNLHIGEFNKNNIVMYSFSTSNTTKPKITNNVTNTNNNYEEGDITTTAFKRLNSYNTNTNINKSNSKDKMSISLINVKKFEKIELLNKLKGKKDINQSEDTLLIC